MAPEAPNPDAQSPPGDWTRRAGAFGDDDAFDGAGFAFEALREHLAEGEAQCVAWCPICRAADLLRANASPELREAWNGVQREALLTIRALIDHHLDRTDEERARGGPRVQDIPID